ncbi:MAG: hypothetical protein ACOZBZ_00495 [Patescibacteria group bacterium]
MPDDLTKPTDQPVTQVPEPVVPPPPEPPPLSPLSPPSPQSPPSPPPSEEPPLVISTPPKKSRVKIILASIVVLVLLASIPAAVFLVQKTQEIREKAGYLECNPGECCGPGTRCSGDGLCNVRDEACVPTPPPPPTPPSIPTCNSCSQDNCCGSYCTASEYCQGDTVSGCQCVAKPPLPTATPTKPPTGLKPPECFASEGSTSVKNPNKDSISCTITHAACQKQEPSYSQCIAENNAYGCRSGTAPPENVTLQGGGTKSYGGVQMACGIWQTDIRAECGSAGSCESGAKDCNWSDALCGGPTPTPGVGALCRNIQATDASWNLLTLDDLSKLKAGDKVYFTVKGETTSGDFDKARFRVNAQAWKEVTAKNPRGEYYDEYTVPSGVTSFTVEAEVHHSTLNQWY